MERVEELCCYYVSLIRAVYLVHQNNHWITSGNNFYGNHLLFERIYKSAAEDADLAAEKFVGLFGVEVLDLHMQAQMIGKILEDFSSGDPGHTSIEIEKKFLDFSQKFYDIVKQEDKMSLGLDDMIMSIASNREGAVYLLKQSITQEGEDMNPRIAARKLILEQIKNAQQSPEAQKLQAKLNTDLTVYIGNKNWGMAGVVNLFVVEQDGEFVANYTVALPANSPPMVAVKSRKDPQAINKFKQEVMNKASEIAANIGIGHIVQRVGIIDSAQINK